MPFKNFWTFNRQISRVQAEEDLRALPVVQSSASAEVASKVSESLTREMGVTAIMTPVRDEAGIKRLKQLGEKMRKK